MRHPDDMPAFNPEPPDEPVGERHPPDVRCPECHLGWIEEGVGCTNPGCGLSWEELEAAHDMLERLLAR